LRVFVSGYKQLSLGYVIDKLGVALKQKCLLTFSGKNVVDEIVIAVAFFECINAIMFFFYSACNSNP
jgi:hypothetical protein